ncbi:hypothetical protein PLICRDRAFT_170114 [Plicaturopsis crispa FD-325 SS-3]|nr:hypothetical protein PLICRDRAFT_170114 [Plicaturopsis crispa FD-325 SS-3]
MPKRIATPPPGDDEPKFLTVVHPYPLNANWELPLDRKEFVFWLSCCIGKDSFFAFHYKPSAPSMVVIEIERDFPRFKDLLGEHRWSEFLKTPSKEEQGKVSRIYYCRLDTGRNVQKNGWKKIHIDEAWFNDWSPLNKKIAYPYPKTHYCALPAEDKTNAPICRPLPVADFPPPAKTTARPPVVGSQDWIGQKVAPPRGAWAKGSAPLMIPAKGRGGKTSAVSPGAPSTNPWTSGAPWETPSTSGTSPSSMSWGSGSNSPVAGAPQTPPGLPPPPGIPHVENQFLLPGEAVEEEIQYGTSYVEPEPEPKKILCSAHGIVCKKGICQAYADQLKKIEREERRKQQASEKTAGGNDNNGRGRGTATRAGRGSGRGGRGGGTSAAPAPITRDGGWGTRARPGRGGVTSARPTPPAPSAASSDGTTTSSDGAAKNKAPGGWGKGIRPTRTTPAAPTVTKDTDDNNGWPASYDQTVRLGNTNEPAAAAAPKAPKLLGGWGSGVRPGAKSTAPSEAGTATPSVPENPFSDWGDGSDTQSVAGENVAESNGWGNAPGW